MEIECDPVKARANFLKHGVEFADVVGALDDPQAITVEDPDSESEQRFITIGLDFLGRLVIVVYTHRGDNIRLISARKATQREVRIYEKGIRF